jgi:phage FluMu protein Com|nr:MAG TPA: DNA-directed RNA polymerase [Caudoviricetes sp.]
MEKIKCEKCGKTLMFAEYARGEIKCPRCGKINKIDKGKSQ